MPEPASFSKAIRLLGIMLMGLGVICNEWILTKAFSPDGVLESLSLRATIWVFDGFCIVSGFFLSWYGLAALDRVYCHATFQKKIPIFIALLFAADLGLSVAYMLHYLIGEPFKILTRLLDLDGESSLSMWYSSIKLYSVSCLLGVHASRHFNWSNRRSWLLATMPLLFLALSADESVQVHEWLGTKADALVSGLLENDLEETFFRGTGIWMFAIGGPFVAILVSLVHSLRTYFHGASGVFRKFVLGLLVWLFGALGVEILANIPGPHTFGQAVQSFFEEGMEMVGITIVLWAAYDLVVARQITLHFDAAVEDQFNRL